MSRPVTFWDGEKCRIALFKSQPLFSLGDLERINPVTTLVGDKKIIISGLRGGQHFNHMKPGNPTNGREIHYL